MTRGKETFVVQNTHKKAAFENRQGNAQRDQIHANICKVLLKSLAVYLLCVRAVSTAERRGNRKHNSASKMCANLKLFHILLMLLRL